MNFTFQRNPKRLLELCGMSAVRDRRQEKLFMEKAAALDAQDLRPLVLVIGGFLDQVLGNSYASASAIPPICAPNTMSGSANTTKAARCAAS